MNQAFVTGGSGFVGRRLISALHQQGILVRALARSDRAATTVEGAGATAVRGDLTDVASLRRGMAGCDVAFHCAAYVEEWGSPDVYDEINVRGTGRVVEAALAARVATLVHVSTEAVLVGGPKLVHVNEQWPYPTSPAGEYPRTKALAEAVVLGASSVALRTIVVRPRLIWGPGDTSLLPKIIDAVKQNRFMWIDGGRYLTSTTHVDNVIEALLLAAERGRTGHIYFVTDGEPVEFRTFLSALLGTRGVQPTTRSIPGSIARGLATVVEGFWRTLRLKSAPPVTKFAIRVMGEEVTIDDSKARTELGYVGRVAREAGIEALRQENA